ncbi:MAG TPA: PAS domain S-box protein [Geothrix sp.]
MQAEASHRATQELAAQVDSAKSRLQLRMRGNEDYLLLLAEEWAQGALDAKTFQDRVARYVNAHPELINITWVDAGHSIRDVAPRALNEGILGLKLSLPEPKRAALLAQDKRLPMYTRSFEAIQGKPSFEVWVPAFREGTFLGLFAGVYSCERLLKEGLPDSLVKDYGFELRGASGAILGEAAPSGPPATGAAMAVELSPPGQGMMLHIQRLRAGMGTWGFLALEWLCALLALGAGYSLWRLRKDILRRKGIEASLLESEERYRAVVGSTTDHIFRFGRGGVLLFGNASGLGFLGAAPEGVIGKTHRDLGFPEHLCKTLEDGIERVFHTGRSEVVAFDLARAGADTSFELRLCAEFATDGSVRSVVGVSRDTTERRSQDRQIARMTQLYAALSQVNQAIVWTDSRESLFAKICEVLVEFGKFKMAWIGWNDPDTHILSPVASCGDVSNYLGTIQVRSDDSPEGQGPGGRAIRENRPCVFNEFLVEEGSQPWREAALHRGYGSIAAFPIRLGGEVCGAISVYAEEPGFFGEQENLLLEEAAMDVSFAMDHHASEDQRKQSEEALRLSEERLRFALEGAHDGLWDVALPANEVYLSPRGCEILGYRPDELPQVARVWSDLVHPDDLALTNERLAEYLEGRAAMFEVEQRLRTKSGAWKWVLARGKVVQHDGEGRPLRMTGTHSDITHRHFAEEQLQESEARFRAMFDKAPMGIAMVDSQSRQILQANARFAAILGRSPESLRRLDWGSLTHPDDLKGNLEDVGRLNAGAIHGFCTEKRYLRPDGSTVWVSMAVERIDPEGEEHPRNLCMIEDISERRQALAQLETTNTLLSAILESHPDVISFALDPEYRYLAFNRKHQEVVRTIWGKEIALGMSMLEVFGAHPDSLAAQRNFDRALTGESFVAIEEYGDEALSRQSWQDFWSPIRLRDGTIAGLTCFVLNITDRMQAEAALRKVSIAIEQSPVSIVIANARGDIEYVNPKFTEVTGYSATESLSQNPRFLGSGEQTPAFYAAMWQTLNQGEVWEGEFRNRRKDGGLFWEHAKISPIRNPEGLITGFVAVKEDITARKQAEQEHRELTAHLQQAQRLESLGALAGGVAHDINNVLAAILSLASAHRGAMDASHPLAKPLETISSACLRGRDVVKSLLSFARKDLETAGPVNLNNLVRDMVQLLAYTTLKRVKLEMDLEEPLSPVLGDNGALSHALMNLCVNALDAMPGGGSLQIRTRRLPDGQIQLSVRDSGPGMTEDVRKHALEPFFTTKGVGKGTGLGLSMAFGTMKAHGGSLDLLSEPGQGTEVRLTFPAFEERPESPAAAGEAAPFSRSLRLLLVDDDELIRLAVGPMLEMMGHRVLTAPDGLEAVRLFEEGLEVDLVILDMNMPGLNGSETLDRLLAIRPGQTVLLASGYHDQDISVLMAKHPKIQSLQKPFSLDDIQRKFAELDLPDV